MGDAAHHTVLIPGLLCSARLYERVLPAVWAHGAATIADTRRDDTLDAMADRLLADAPPRFALVGLSMGGYIALAVLRRAPERVRAVALVSTSARPDTPEQTARRRALTAMARAGRFGSVVEELRAVMLRAPDDEALHALWTSMAGDVGPEAFCAQQTAIIARPDSRPLLPAVACPAAVIHGAQDALLPLAHGEELAAGIPGAALTVVDDCGHLSTLERPAEVAAGLDALLGAAP